MALNDGDNSTIHRQLAPTVGPTTPRVTFRDGILGGIGETITVGTAVSGEEGGYIVDDDSYMPTNDYLVSACIFPIGVHNIFIGMTPEALGLPRCKADFQGLTEFLKNNSRFNYECRTDLS